MKVVASGKEEIGEGGLEIAACLNLLHGARWLFE